MSSNSFGAPVYIVSAARTPVGAFLGSLATVRAPELGSTAIKGALARAKLTPDQIGEVFMGNVLSAGIGQAPARQAMICAGIPNTVPATTVSKVCGSGLQAVIFGAKTIALGEQELVVSGGMESMSNAPYYMTRGTLRMGNATLVDGMIHDGLWDPYGNVHMGACGDACAKEYNFSREAQDEYTRESFRRALAAQKEGMFDAEIEPVSVVQKKGDPVIVKLDEGPSKGDPSRFASLKPAFTKDGTITAANAASINDGASALVLASEAAVKAHKLEPLAKIVGWGASARQIHHRTGQGDRSAHEKTRHLGRRDRSVRDQRSIRGRRDGLRQAHQYRPREGQRSRRRGRSRPSDRLERLTHFDDARLRDERSQRETRSRHALHRRR